MTRRPRPLARWTPALLAAPLSLAGCDPGDPPPAAPQQPARRAPAPSDWRVIDDSIQVAVPPGDLDDALAAAIEQARASLEGARLRWTAGDAPERSRWAVKWAARTAGGGAEHVWVRPLSWSLYRVEGRLASPPQQPLEGGGELGATVGFPAEEIVDWMRELAPDDGPDARREGAFTTVVLEARFGRPQGRGTP